MREIKFRAYDKKMKRMFLLGDDVNHDSLWFKNHKARYFNLQNGSGGEEYELMQYTGLKDCKGNEIYENDIVEFTDKSSSYKYKQKIEWDNECGGFISSLFMTGEKDTEYEVIGNIYMNPELLK